MLNFELHNPTRIVFGRDTISQLNTLIPPQARVLVLAGGQSAFQNGTIAEVQLALAPREVQLFRGIESTPRYETLLDAVAQVREQKLDFLLAVGGGSVIDATKFVAAAIDYPADPWHIVETQGSVIQSAMPFATVLTLPATGSEMNNIGVITRAASASKLVFRSTHCYPRFSILDPSKSFTLPVAQIANGAADAITHVLEQYLTYPVGGRVQDRLAEALLSTLIEIGPAMLASPLDYELRANMMWSATLALNGLIGAGVPQDWASHALAHELTASFNIEHARALAVVMPALLRERRTAKAAKLLQYAERVWQITDGTPEQRIAAGIDRTQQLFEALGLPTRLADYGVTASELPQLIVNLELHGRARLGEHADITPEVAHRIYQRAL